MKCLHFEKKFSLLCLNIVGWIWGEYVNITVFFFLWVWIQEAQTNGAFVPDKLCYGTHFDTWRCKSFTNITLQNPTALSTVHCRHSCRNILLLLYFMAENRLEYMFLARAITQENPEWAEPCFVYNKSEVGLGKLVNVSCSLLIVSAFQLWRCSM